MELLAIAISVVIGVWLYDIFCELLEDREDFGAHGLVSRNYVADPVVISAPATQIAPSSLGKAA